MCQWIMDKFPALFGFQSCGLLFVDPETSQLFRFEDSLDQTIVITFPQNVGCTGDAIKQRKIIYFDDIKQQPRFENVIDNSQGKYLVQSLLIAPIYDSDGKLKGVVQLVNKEGKIMEKDV